ncbi:YdhK family protein [Corynebacterium sp.]|uniref:YdhK family protein n=1 Tax=Corynebacterium sp. TaxID=1720 RepID=UPI0026DF3AE8|nr:YdhK family protein [Corynebacterium sp.]MDO5513200.1 YdhK family protein [Corynebacterium sp.]
MTRTTMLIPATLIAATLALSACTDNTEDSSTASLTSTSTSAPATDTAAASQSEATHGGQGGHDGMEHPADGGPVPEGMAQATDPTYPVGTEVTLTADHMEGMNGAIATIVGAYDTYTYAIDYTPTDGKDPVLNHKWVVQEELKDAGDDRLDDGTEVTVTADHMHGMGGATAMIASSTDETVYVVDYEADGMTMTNHKWVVESEIKPAS